MRYEERVRNLSSSLTKTDNHIHQFILENQEFFLKLPLSKISEMTATSPASWTRFAKKLNYTGMNDLKVSVASETQKHNEEELNNILEKSDTLNVLVDKIQRVSLNTINNTYSLLNLDVLKEAIDALTKSRRIYLLGIGGSTIICLDLMHKLTRINRAVIYYEDSEIILSQIAHITKEDIVIAISYSGETKVVNQVAQYAKEKGAPIITITKYNIKTTLSKLADYPLFIPEERSDLRLGSIESRNASLIITDLLYFGVARTDFDHTKITLQETKKLVERLSPNKRTNY